jgi:hypothetical protein
MEKARLYAASNGDIEGYACYTALQSWMYLISSFLPNGVSISLNNVVQAEINALECKQWAVRLRDEALLSYAETGLGCYLRLKEKSGVTPKLLERRQKELTEYGTYRIDPIPPFREKFEEGGSKVVENLSQANDITQKLLELDMSLLATRQSSLSIKENSKNTNSIYLFGPNSCYLFFARAMCDLCTNLNEEFVPEGYTHKHDVGVENFSLSDWRRKLERTYRLFNYAWAIADDGGEIEKCELDETGAEIFKISRPFDNSAREMFQEATALRDLYPLRVSEISELGRLFAALCAALRIYTCSGSSEEVTKREQEARWLLEDLHRVNHCEYLNSVSCPHGNEGLLNGQAQYNGHIKKYLDDCKEQILREIVKAKNEKSKNNTPLSTIRNEAVRKIFNNLTR